MGLDYVIVHDNRGRIVIPQKIREALGIVSGTLLQLTTENQKILIEKVK
jgi:AbrB family looped-hinge helix DNA binding protein